MNDVKTDNQKSFFDIDGEENITTSSKIDIVEMKYNGVKSMDWAELFHGYTKARIITYSSGIGFAYQLIKQFSDCEIIFGCEAVMSYSFMEIMAFQSKLISRLNETAGKMKIDLIERIKNGSLRIYVAREKLSHEKLYLLEAENGRKRVITGSANMSYQAFNGRQRENICYLDDEAGFDWYSDVYELLKNSSADSVEEKALLSSSQAEDVENIPIAQTIKEKKVLQIMPDNSVTDEIKFVLDVQNAAKQYHSVEPAKEKNGKIMITADKIHSIRRQFVDMRDQESEMRKEYPQLVINAEEGRAVLNEKELDIAPSTDEVKKDVGLFIQYMNGYEKFHGDVDGVQRRYFEFANWFFCTPFMPQMRELASRYNQNPLPYPVFGLVYGQSKAGKTSFLETLLKMMIGQKTKISAPDFTRSSIEALKHTVQGAPIIVDDLTNTRFNQHAIETIKNDGFGINEHLLYYPAVVISANEDVKAVAPEVIRRTVICRVQIGLTNTEVMKSNIVRCVQKEIGTAFYREYLKRMFEIMPELISQIKDDRLDAAPDILHYSSKILCDIIRESIEDVPSFVRELTLDDYFSERVTGKQAIEQIKMAWKTNKKAFEVLKRQNELRYNAGQTYDADRIIKELPETLEPRKAREIVIMNLEEAKGFFGMNFKKGMFGLLSQK